MSYGHDDPVASGGPFDYVPFPPFHLLSSPVLLLCECVGVRQVGQTTAVGATAPSRGDQSFPVIHITDFRACANQSPTHAAAKVRTVDMSSIMGLKNGNKEQKKVRHTHTEHTYICSSVGTMPCRTGRKRRVSM